MSNAGVVMVTDFSQCPLAAGLIGLAAIRPDLVRSDWSLELPSPDELNSLAEASGLNADGRIYYPVWGDVPDAALARLTIGLCLTLISHGRHRDRLDDDGRLSDFLHRRGFKPQKSGLVPKVTRGHLPNWQDDGDKFVPERAWPLLFAPAALIALPLSGGVAVLLAPGPCDLRTASHLVTAGVPRATADLYAASAADAALSYWLRVRSTGIELPELTAYTYRFTPGNSKFRAVAGVRHFAPPSAAVLDRWAEVAVSIGVRTGKHGPYPDEVRGLAADNCMAGRPMCAGFSDLCKTPEGLKNSRFGAPALVSAL